jgi:hypothetical protein
MSHGKGVKIKGTGKVADPDSAVTMYWGPKPLPPTGGKEDPSKRLEVGFAYGLGSFVSDNDGHLLASIGGRLVRGGEFTLNALVNEPVKGERLKIELPGGLTLVKDDKKEKDVLAAQAVDGRRQSSVSWKIHADKEGAFTITVTSTNGAKVSISGRVNRGAELD